LPQAALAAAALLVVCGYDLVSAFRGIRANCPRGKTTPDVAIIIKMIKYVQNVSSVSGF
jgi:hypothetical protein